MKITGESRVRDVVEQHPATGEIFIQKGALFRNKRGELYAVYDPDRSVAAFAEESGVALDRLLADLAAAAEASPLGPSRRQDTHGAGAADRRGGSPRLSIGYTGSYREAGDVETRSVVEVQRARGPL